MKKLFALILMLALASPAAIAGKGGDKGKPGGGGDGGGDATAVQELAYRAEVTRKGTSVPVIARSTMVSSCLRELPSRLA